MAAAQRQSLPYPTGEAAGGASLQQVAALQQGEGGLFHPRGTPAAAGFYAAAAAATMEEGCHPSSCSGDSVLLFMAYVWNGDAMVYLGLCALEQLLRDHGLHCLGDAACRDPLWEKELAHACARHPLRGCDPFCFRPQLDGSADQYTGAGAEITLAHVSRRGDRGGIRFFWHQLPAGDHQYVTDDILRW